jgi:hypothetical protein
MSAPPRRNAISSCLFLFAARRTLRAGGFEAAAQFVGLPAAPRADFYTMQYNG